MKRCLVTGAAGFIASNVCEQLLSSGRSVVGLDSFDPYYDTRLKAYRLEALRRGKFKPGQFEFREANIEDPSQMEAIFSEFKFDTVYNLAAKAGVRNSLLNPRAYVATNTSGTLNILEAMRVSGTRKLVLASTSSLYAGCSAPFHETFPVNEPISPYAASKKAGELMAYAYHKQYDIDVSVVRYFTVYGPSGRPDMSIFRFVKAILQGSPIHIFGDGSQARDFTFVSDVARGTIMASGVSGYEIFNVGGGGTPVDLMSVIKMIEQLTGQRTNIIHHPAHSADVQSTMADITKAKERLRWIPVVSLADGIAKTVEWHQENRDFVATLEE